MSKESNLPDIAIPAIQQTWVRCPYCRAKVVVYDNTAECHGVFLKCTRGCKKTFELVIHRGRQVST